MKRLAAILAAAPFFGLLAQGPPSVRPSAPPKGAPPSPADLKFPPLRPAGFPKAETFTLSNGMKIFLMEDHDLPVIAGTAMVRTGSLFDPPDKAGLAALTGIVMRSGGAGNRTGEQIDAQVENAAGSVECAIGERSATLSFSALRDSAEGVMEAFRDVMTASEFRQDRIDFAKAQARNSILHRNDDLAAVAQREFREAVYGKDTAQGRRAEYATIRRIGRGDLQAFHRRYFFPANVRLAVHGDFTTDEMKVRLEKLFSGWTAQHPPVPEFPKVEARSPAGLFVAPKRDALQTTFIMGTLGGDLKDKDYPAASIAAAILGQGRQSRLGRRLGPQAIGTLNVQWATEYDGPGLFRISGTTRSNPADAMKIVFDEVERMRTNGITEEELRTARDSALNSMVFAFDTRAKALQLLLTYDYFGYPADAFAQMQKSFAALAKADVERVIRERLDPARFTIVAAGSPAELVSGLEALGRPPAPIDLTIPQPALEAAKGDESSIEKGKRLLTRAQAAAGGVEKLAAVKDTTMLADFKLSPAAGGMTVAETDRWIAPSFFKQESQIPRQGKIIAFFDGKSGTIGTPTGSGILAGPKLKQVRGDLFRLYIRLLFSDRIEGRTVNAIDDHTIEVSDTAGEIARLVLDPATGLVERVLYDTVPEAGPQISAEETFSDFRDVAGVKVPFAFTIRQSGQKFADVTVVDFRINQGLKVEDLRRLQ